MKTIEKAVQTLERVEEVKALLKGDWVNAVLPDGFHGEICLVGNTLSYGQSFARENGDKIRVYHGLHIERINDGKIIVSDTETEAKDYSGETDLYKRIKPILRNSDKK